MLILAGVSFAACRKQTASTGSAAGGAPALSQVAGKSIVRVGIQNDPGTLAPWAARNGGMIAVYRSMYEYLIDRDTFGGEMRGALMKEWKQVDDVTYNITLYDYIADTEGNKMTASDVRFSYETAMGTGVQPKLGIIDSVSVVDQYTAAFKFKNPLSLGDLEAILSEIPVVTEASYNASPDKMASKPVGTTAYRVAEVSAGSKIVLQKTGKYWQTDSSKSPLAAQANVDTIEFDIIREAAQLVIALETGAIDVTANISNARQVARFKEGGDLANSFTVFDYMNNPVYGLFFNCASGKPFAKSLALRQAVAYAIDRKGIVSGVFGGNGVPLKMLGSSKYGDYDKAWDSQPYYEYDVEKAKSLLAQAGYGSGGLKLKLITGNQENFVNMATIVQGYLQQIGLTVEITPYEPAMFKNLQRDENAYDFYIDQVGSTDYVVNVWKLCFAAVNYGGVTMNFVDDGRLQSLLDTCVSIAGHTPANINAFNTYLNDNMYALGLAVDYGFVVGNKRITNVLLDSRNQIIPAGCSYDFAK